jgi:uncharacterized protein (DUF433 family)
MNALTRIDWDKIGQVGLYPVSMAARILGENSTKVKSWIDGYPNSDAEPIIHRQLPPINGRTVFGFLDLIEARFIRHFDHLGLSPQFIRKIADKLRRRHNTDHPFATNKRFRTDGKTIIMETLTDDEIRLLNLRNDHFEMETIIKPSLFQSVLYADDLAYRWHPVRGLPRVALDPKYAFGRPVIEDAWVPTDTLYGAFQAEGSIASVAADFDIDEDAVEQAVAYEEKLCGGEAVEDPTGRVHSE